VRPLPSNPSATSALLATQAVYIRARTHTRSDTAGHVQGGTTYKRAYTEVVYRGDTYPGRHIPTKIPTLGGIYPPGYPHNWPF